MSLDSIYQRQNDTASEMLRNFDDKFADVLEKINSLASFSLKGLDDRDILEYDLIWSQILEQAGYYKLVAEYVDISFDDVYDDILVAFDSVGLATAFTEADLIKINILKSMHKEFFVKLGNDVGLTVKKQLYNYTLANASLEQIASNIRADIENTGLAKYSRTYARTAVGNYQQEVINIRSADEDGVWVYVGVDDGKTRPFCHNLLKQRKYYTTQQKNRLERDEDREFNCRHRFYLVSKDWAEDENYEKY